MKPHLVERAIELTQPLSQEELRTEKKLYLPFSRVARDVKTRQNRSTYSFGMNQQLYDLGIQSDRITTEKGIQDAIDDIDATFNLVMIAEQMQESLVLLADLLCIPLEDVATLDNSNKNGKVQKLSDNEAKTLKKHLGPERLLYDHFVARLKERIT